MLSCEKANSLKALLFRVVEKRGEQNDGVSEVVRVSRPPGVAEEREGEERECEWVSRIQREISTHA